jgi:UDP-N-acetylmuramyl tripeptide synthase
MATSFSTTATGAAPCIVDFAHNPHGQRALIQTAQALPARRKAIILGQAGDRDDASIRGLARETWPWRPDLIVLKEMPEHLRGRKPGETTGILKDKFIRLGAPRGIFLHADSELEAVRDALAWAREGDLVLLPVHAQRDEVLALMERLEVRGWKAGAALPE